MSKKPNKVFLTELLTREDGEPPISLQNLCQLIINKFSICPDNIRIVVMDKRDGVDDSDNVAIIKFDDKYILVNTDYNCGEYIISCEEDDIDIVEYKTNPQDYIETFLDLDKIINQETDLYDNNTWIFVMDGFSDHNDYICILKNKLMPLCCKLVRGWTIIDTANKQMLVQTIAANGLNYSPIYIILINTKEVQ